MRHIKSLCLGLAAVLIAPFAPAWAGQDTASTGPLCSESYPYLTCGPTQAARLASLPEGVVAKINGKEITQSRLTEELSRLPDEEVPIMGEAPILLLDRIVAEELLAVRAKEARLSDNGEAQATLPEGLAKWRDDRVKRFVAEEAAKVKVTEEDVRSLYHAYRLEFADSPYDNIRDDVLVPLAREEKQKRLIGDLVKKLAGEAKLELDSGFAESQWKALATTPVDEARGSGLPFMVHLGSGGCITCVTMRPALAELQEEYKASAKFLFLHVDEHPVTFARYGVDSIPVQVFFDKNGGEVWRHLGYLDKDEIRSQLQKMGVKPGVDE